MNQTRKVTFLQESGSRVTCSISNLRFIIEVDLCVTISGDRTLVWHFSFCFVLLFFYSIGLKRLPSVTGDQFTTCRVWWSKTAWMNNLTHWTVVMKTWWRSLKQPVAVMTSFLPLHHAPQRPLWHLNHYHGNLKSGTGHFILELAVLEVQR